MHISTQIQQSIQQEITGNFIPPINRLARNNGVSEQAIIECFPPDKVTRVSATHFYEIMVMIANWGEVEVVLQTQVIDIHIKGHIPIGEMHDSGEYRFVDGDIYPFGGSIRADRIESVYFLDNFGDVSPYIVFFDYCGTRLFSIHPYMDEQVEYIRTLRDRITDNPGCSCCS